MFTLDQTYSHTSLSIGREGFRMKRGLILLCSLVIILLLWYRNINVGNDSLPHKEDMKDHGETSQDKGSDESKMNSPYSLSTDNEEWVLVWEEHFNGSELNQEDWNIENWPSNKNNELQYYTPNNILVEDGLLKIVSKKERYGGREYTSGAIHSKDKFHFLYGKVEMRARLPAGQGVWPAFWMLPNKDQTWLPEIDIMEMLGHQPNKVWMTLHWLDLEKKQQKTHSVYKGPDYSSGFHTFGVEWTPHSITWLTDGKKRFKTNQYIPQEEMYLYLNTAIGGDWPGNPDDTTKFPVYYEVDYVKVYEKSN